MKINNACDINPEVTKKIRQASFNRFIKSLESEPQNFSGEKYIKDIYNAVFDKTQPAENKKNTAVAYSIIAMDTLRQIASDSTHPYFSAFTQQVRSELNKIPFYDIYSEEHFAKASQYLSPTVDYTQDDTEELEPAFKSLDAYGVEEESTAMKTLYPIIGFQPTVYEVDNSDEPTFVSATDSKVEAYNVFVKKLISSNGVQSVDGKSDFFLKLYNSEAIQDKLYGKAASSKYVYVLVDNSGKPYEINTEGSIVESEGSYVFFAPRINAELIDNGPSYEELLNWSDKDVISYYLNNAQKPNNSILKASEFLKREEKSLIEDRVKNPNRFTELKERRLQSIALERNKLMHQQAVQIRNVVKQIKNISKDSIYNIDFESSRLGYVRYLPIETRNLTSKGAHYITKEDGSFLEGVDQSSLQYESYMNNKDYSVLLVNGTSLKIFSKYNSASVNPRLVPLVQSLVKMMSAPIYSNGELLTFEQKRTIWNQFLFDSTSFFDLKKALEKETIVHGASPIVRGDVNVYNREFETALYNSVAKANLKHVTAAVHRNNLRIPTLTERSEGFDVVFTSMEPAQYASKYLRLSVTPYPKKPDFFPMVNPALAVGNEEISVITKAKDISADLVEDEDLAKDRLSPNIATVKDIVAAEKWFNENPISKYMSVRKAFDIVNSKALATWSIAGVTLFKGSNFTDVYHEAWHEFTELYLDSEQRKALLSEVQKLKGEISFYHKGKKQTKLASQVTYKEAMEFLAEDFREYMINNKRSVFSRIVKAIFDKIKELLSVLFGKTSYFDVQVNPMSSPTIAEMYRNLYKGDLSDYKYYGDPSTNNRMDLTAAYITEEKKQFTPDETHIAISSIDSAISGFISSLYRKAADNNKGQIPNSVIDYFKPGGLPNLYRKVKESFEAKLKRTNDKLVVVSEQLIKKPNSRILNQQVELLNKRKELLTKFIENLGDPDQVAAGTERNGLFAFHLKTNKYINTIFKIAEDEADMSAKDEGNYIDKGNNSTTFQDDAPPVISYIMSIIPDLPGTQFEIDAEGLGDGDIYIKRFSRGKTQYYRNDEQISKADFENQQKIHKTVNVLGYPILARPEKVFSIVANVIGGVSSPSKMIQNLTDNADSNPIIRDISVILGAYIPIPTNLSDVTLSPELLERRKANIKNLIQLHLDFWQTFAKQKVRSNYLKLNVSTILDDNVEQTDINTEVLTSDTNVQSLSAQIENSYDTNITLYKNNEAYAISNQSFDPKLFAGIVSSKVSPQKYIQENRIELLKILGLIPIAEDPTEDFKKSLNTIEIAQGLQAIVTQLIRLADVLYKNPSANPDFYRNIVSLLKRGGSFIVGKDTFTFDKQITFVNKILANYAKHQGAANNFMYINSEGNLENEFSYVSSLTNIARIMNELKEYSDFINPKNGINGIWDPKLNPMIKYSKIAMSYFDRSVVNPGISKRLGVNMEIYKTGGVISEITTRVGQDQSSSTAGLVDSSLTYYSKIVSDIIKTITDGTIRMSQHSGKNTQHDQKIEIARTDSKGNPIGEVSMQAPDKTLYISVGDFAQPVSPSDLDSSGFSGDRRFVDIMIGYLAGESEIVEMGKRGRYNNLNINPKMIGEYLSFSFLSKELREHLKELSSAAYDSVESNPYALYDAIINSPQYSKIRKEILDHYLKEVSYIKDSILKYNALDLESSHMLGIEVQNRVKVEADPNLVIDRALRAYTANKMISFVENMTVIYGNPINYALLKEEFHKRNALWGSGGKIIPTDDVYTALIQNYFFENSLSQKLHGVKPTLDPTDIKVAVVKDVVVKSSSYDSMLKKYTEFYRSEEIAKAKLEPYEKMKEADAQGVASLDYYRFMSLFTNNWDDTKEGYYQRILKGEKFGSEQVKEFFPSLKYQYIGPGVINDVGVTQSLKFNIVPLIPNAIDGLYMEDIHNKMMKEDIGILTFASGSKNAFPVAPQNVFYDKEGNTPSEPYKTMSIHAAFLKDQLYIAPIYKSESIFSTQKRSKILDLFFEQGSLINPDNAPYVEDYKEAIKLGTKVSRDILESELGIDFDNINAKDVSGFAAYIRSVLKSKGMLTEEELNLIFAKDGKFQYDLSLSGFGPMLDELLAKLIEKRLISQKYLGEPLIQVASTGYESRDKKRTYTKENVYGSNDLLFYREGPSGETLPAQVKIALQGKFFFLLNLKHKDGSKIETRERLNEMMQDSEWKSTIMSSFLITGDRIPVQGHPSMEFLEVVEFLDPLQGNIIILPTEIVAKSGGDFDVDKLTLLFPAFYPDGSLMTYNKSYQESIAEIKSIKNQALKEIKDEIAGIRKDLDANKESRTRLYLLREVLKAIRNDMYHSEARNVGSLDQEDLQTFNEYVANTPELQTMDDFYLEDTLTFNDIRDKINEYYQELKTLEESFKDDIEYENELREALKKPFSFDVGAKEKFYKALFYKDNILGAVSNRINNSIVGLLSRPDMFVNLTLPNDVADSTKIAYDNLNRGFVEFDYKYKPYSLMSPFYDAMKMEHNKVGKDGLGMVATSNVLTPGYSEYGLTLNKERLAIVKGKPVLQPFFELKLPHKKTTTLVETVDAKGVTHRATVNSIVSSSQTSVTGTSISDTNSQWINGTVDVEKEAWAFYYKLVKEVMPVALALNNFGVDPNMISKFLSNPMLYRYIREQRFIKDPMVYLFRPELAKNPDKEAMFRNMALEQTYPFQEFIVDFKDQFTSEQLELMYSRLSPGGGWTTRAFDIAGYIIASKTKEYTLDRLIDIADENSDINPLIRKAAFIHYKFIENYVINGYNKLSFALRSDVLRPTSIFDFSIFADKFSEILENGRGIFNTDQLIALKSQGVRSSFFISPKSAKTIGSSLVPTLYNDEFLSVVAAVINSNTTYYGDKTNKAVSLVANGLRSYVIQKAFYDMTSNTDVYKGIQFITNPNDIGPLEVNIAPFKDNLVGLIGDKSTDTGDYSNFRLYIDPLNISYAFEKSLYYINNNSDIKNDVAFYRKFGYLPIGKLKTEQALRQILVEKENLRLRHSKTDFLNSALYELNYALYNPLKGYSGVTPSQAEMDSMRYDVWLRDTAILNTMQISLLQSSKDNNIGNYLNYLKQTYPTVVQQYSILQQLSSNKKNDNTFLTLGGIVETPDVYQNELSQLMNPSTSKTGNKFDDLYISNVLTMLGVYTMFMNPLIKQNAQLQSVFINRRFMNMVNDVLPSINMKEALDKVRVKVSGMTASNQHRGRLFDFNFETVDRNPVLYTKQVYDKTYYLLKPEVSSIPKGYTQVEAIPYYTYSQRLANAKKKVAQTENVVVSNTTTLSSIRNLPVFSPKGINTMRSAVGEYNFGNPFIGSVRQGMPSTVDNVMTFNTVAEADRAYNEWLDGTREAIGRTEAQTAYYRRQREFILEEIERLSSETEPLTLLYYKPTSLKQLDGTTISGYHSHADSLRDRIVAKRKEKAGVQSTVNVTEYIDHSGGAGGADSVFDREGKKFGMQDFQFKHYYTGTRSNLNAPLGNVDITGSPLAIEGSRKVAQAASAMWGYQYSTMKDERLIRNWAQVFNAEAVFAVAPIGKKGDVWSEDVSKPSGKQRIVTKSEIVQGGTGYAVEMAIQAGKPVFVYNDPNQKASSHLEKGWYTWDGSRFVPIQTPVLTKNFAGIGSRNISKEAEAEIRKLYVNTFGSSKAEVKPEPKIFYPDMSLVNSVLAFAQKEGIDFSKDAGSVQKDLFKLLSDRYGKSIKTALNSYPTTIKPVLPESLVVLEKTIEDPNKKAVYKSLLAIFAYELFDRFGYIDSNIEAYFRNSDASTWYKSIMIKSIIKDANITDADIEATKKFIETNCQ